MIKSSICFFFLKKFLIQNKVSRGFKSPLDFRSLKSVEVLTNTLKDTRSPKLTSKVHSSPLAIPRSFEVFRFFSPSKSGSPPRSLEVRFEVWKSASKSLEVHLEVWKSLHSPPSSLTPRRTELLEGNLSLSSESIPSAPSLSLSLLKSPSRSI